MNPVETDVCDKCMFAASDSLVFDITSATSGDQINCGVGADVMKPSRSAVISYRHMRSSERQWATIQST